jgi:hypothetical protein
MNNFTVLPLRKQYYAPSKDTWVLAILDALSRTATSPSANWPAAWA